MISENFLFRCFFLRPIAVNFWWDTFFALYTWTMFWFLRCSMSSRKLFKNRIWFQNFSFKGNEGLTEEPSETASTDQPGTSSSAAQQEERGDWMGREERRSGVAENPASQPAPSGVPSSQARSRGAQGTAGPVSASRPDVTDASSRLQAILKE